MLVKQGRVWPVLLVCIKAKALREEKREEKLCTFRLFIFFPHTVVLSLLSHTNAYERTSKHTLFIVNVNRNICSYPVTEKVIWIAFVKEYALLPVKWSFIIFPLQKLITPCLLRNNNKKGQQTSVFVDRSSSCLTEVFR